MSNTNWRNALVMVISLLALNACQGNPGGIPASVLPAIKVEEASPHPARTSTPRNEATALPTDVFVQTGDDPVPTRGTQPTAAPDPFRFEFPEAPPQPVSAWRPPLYPIPWAPTPYDHFYMARPIAADEVNWPLANYRYGGVFFEGVVHTGVDIPASKGTPVIASGDGKVIWAGWGLYRGVYDDRSDPYGQA
ncbi:MAG: M23 family metallopeptidase, partial [Anaerolineales bacterium]|nr:M23 family metallopeptidase [Anaerolineales bacterium]